MTAADPFDYPDDDPAELCPKPEPPQPAHTVPDHDDDEAAFWRNAREGNDRPPPAEHAYHSNYGEWMASERRVAYRVKCPDCMMAVDVPCIRIDAKGPITPPQPLRKLPAHESRLRLARKATR